MRDIKERLVTSEIRKLVPVLGKENAERLGRAYLIGDEDTRKRIFELLDVTKAAVLSDRQVGDAILMEPLPEDIAGQGSINLGTVVYGKKRLYPYLLEKGQLLTHIGVFGSSGYGKTNVSYWLVSQLAEMGIPVLIFDFSKRNYRDLLGTPLKDKTEVFTVGRDVVPFAFNPLRPPAGISQSQWMKEFALVFDHAYWLLGGGRHIILKALDAIHAEKKQPRLADLRQWIMSYGSSSLPPRERNWLATAARPLESLCFRELGEMFNTETGIEPSELFRDGRVTVLELDALSENDRAFFIEIMLQWLRDWLLVSHRREELRGVIILEEAHHVLNREKANKMGSETVMDLVFREVRELGMGVIYIDQHPSLVSYPALGNTSTHVYMNLGLDTKHSSDILDAMNMLGLDYDDERNYLRKLPVGTGMVLSRNSGFPNPFVMQFPQFALQKGLIRDEDLKRAMEKRVQEIYREYGPAASGRPREPKMPRQGTEKRHPAKQEQEVDPRRIDEKGWSILRALGEGRGAFTSQLYKFLGLSGKVFNEHARRLMDDGLVGTRAGKIGKNRMNYFFLTSTGLSLYESQFARSARQVEPHGDAGLAEVIDMMRSAGWAYDRAASRFTMQHNGRPLHIAVEQRPDRRKVRADVQTSHYFLCANDRLCTMVVQEAAHWGYERGAGRVIFVSTLKKFGETGTFSKIEIA